MNRLWWKFLFFLFAPVYLFGQSSTYSTTLDFDGSDSFITIPSGNSDLSFSSDKFTLEAWIKIENAPPSGSTSGNNTASNRDYIFAKKNDWSLYVLNIGGSLYLEGRFRRDYHGNWPDIRSSTTISTDTWYHVAFTNSKSDGRIRIYINGNLDNQEFWTQQGYGLTSTTNTIGIGASVWNGIDNATNFFDGEMSDIRFWDDERSQSEINYYKNSTLNTSSNLKLYYRLNEGSGSTINDSSGNSITGTARGSYQWKNAGPTVTLTDTDSDNLVSGSSVVTITATFSESMAATPTINITGEVSNAVMTASSTASVWIYPWTVSTTTSGIISATVSGTNLTGNAYSGTDSITFTIDNSAPTVTLTDTDSNNIVTGSNVVTITATFSESMEVTPTINITGEVSNAVMTASSTASVWIYPWTVSTTTSGIVSATVSGADLAGNAYSGTNSITFTISQTIYFDGSTCKCPNATVGDSTTISGTTYIAVNNSTIGSEISAGNYNLCTTLVTSMTELFESNSSFNSNISFWDMSNVTNTDRMFQGASSFNQDIGGWDTSNFYDVSGMFKSANSFNQDIGGWDTAKITNMAGMFNYAESFNQDLTSWCVSRISSEPGAFAGNTSILTDANKPIWGTCGTLTSSDSDNYISLSTTVTITAGYNKTITNTPQISITNVTTNTNMTQITGTNSYTYSWQVGSALADGKYYATLSGTDLYNNTYSGSNSITFTIDTVRPNIISTTVSNNLSTDYISQSGTNTITVVFNEKINDNTFTVSDVTILPSGFSITPYTSTDYKTFSGTITATDTLSFSGIVTLTLVENTVEDLAGNLNTISTTTFLFDNIAPYLSNLSDTDSDNLVSGSDLVTITATFNEALSTSPTINITNEVSNVPMTASATSNIWIYPWTVSTTTSGIVSATVSANDLANNAYSGIESITFTIDNSAPNVTLTDNDSDNLVIGSSVVNIIATFSEAMASTPTINIGTEVSNVLMTASSTSNIWTYLWTVSATTSGIVTATVSGSDVSGNAYSGTDSITFTIDNSAPQIISSGLTSDNLFFNITFDENVFTDLISGQGSNSLQTSDFEFSISSSSSYSLSTQNPQSITQSGTSYALEIPAQGFGNGSGTISLNILNNSIYDIAGNSFSSTITKNLNDNLLIYYDFSNVNSYNGNTTSSSNKTVSNLNGNSNNGEIKGVSNVFYESFNDAIYFDGNSGGEKGIAISDLNYVTGDSDEINELTILSRIKLSSTTSNHGNDQRILFSFDRSAVFRFSVGSDQNSNAAGKLAFHFANSDKHAQSSGGSHDTYAVSQTLDLRDDKWHDVAVSFKANTSNGLKFYVDNNLVYSHPDSFKPISNQTDSETPRYGWVGNGSESSSAGSSTGPDHLFLGYVQSLKYFNKQLDQSFLNGIDQSRPNVQLSDTDNDNLVSTSDVVTITATFNESLLSSPTISLSGAFTNATMTASSTANIWFYKWIVEESFNGTGFATVAGSDKSGNVYSGTESITFKDLIPPKISSTSVQDQNEYVDIIFDQPVYGNINASSSITSSSFSIIQTSGSSLTLNILGFRANNSTTFSGASQLSGGETTIRIFMDLSSLSPVGSEVFSVSATNSSSIFDINGNGMLTAQTSSFTLKLPISGPVNPTKSTISVVPEEMIANGSNIAIVNVQTKDSLGLSFFRGGNDIIIFNSSGDLPTIDNLDGTYSVNFKPEEINLAEKDFVFGFKVAGIDGGNSTLLTLHQDKDGDGVYSANDLCPATKEGFEVDENGCALYQKDTDKDGVFDDLDQCPETPKFEKNNVKGTPRFGEMIPTEVDEKGCGASQRDIDGDGIVDNLDNCIETANQDQLDSDQDGIGDICDTNNPLPEIITTEIKFVQLPPNGTIVGKIEANDIDKETLIFKSIGTDLGNVLSLAPDGTIIVINGVSLDFKSPYNGASLNFIVSDGTNEVKGNVIIRLEDKPRPPEIIINTFEISEDAEVGSLVGLVGVKDPMGGQIVSVNFSGDGFLELVNENEIRTTQELDYETITAHPFTITATASDQPGGVGLTGSKSESVIVTDIPNATYTGSFFISIFDVNNESLGAKVGPSRYFNPHNKGVGKWKVKKKIKGGADASKFVIKSRNNAQQKTDEVIEDENEDFLAFITPPDYENPGDANKDNIYEVEIEYINTADGQPDVPISVTQRNIRVPEGKSEAIELQSQPVLPTDDNDGDGIADILDNSPLVSNPDQTDEDGDGVGDATDDFDHDGVWNPFDICPDTPDGELVNIEGCLIYYLPPSNFSISKTEKCAGQNSINLSVVDDTLLYNVSVNGDITISDSFTGNRWSLDELSAGVYNICVNVEGVSPLEFERCFQVTISEPSPLVVSSFFSKANQSVSFVLDGGSSYQVTHNGKTTQTESNKHSVSLEKGINNISISTGIECQGLFQETYLNSYEVKYVPNPFKHELQLYIGGQDNIVEIGIYSSNGQLIDYQNISLPFGVRNYTLNTAKYKTGVYIINIKGKTIDQSIQVIKE